MWVYLSKKNVMSWTTKNKLPTNQQPIGLINAVWMRRWLYSESEVYHLLYVMFCFKDGSLPQQLWGHCLCYCTKSRAHAPIKNFCLRLISQQTTNLLYDQASKTSCIFNSFSSYPRGKPFFLLSLLMIKLLTICSKGAFVARQWSQRFQHHL